MALVNHIGAPFDSHPDCTVGAVVYERFGMGCFAANGTRDMGFRRQGAEAGALRWLGRKSLSLLKLATLFAAVASAATLGSAVPAASGAGFILPSRSIAAPAGFSGVCDRYAWVCTTHSRAERAMSDDELLATARTVNGGINRRVRQVSDQSQYRKAELWALPTARGGDCEDFALLKKRELMRLGVAPDRLLIATALTARREPHAVLILRTNGGDLVLDNRTSQIKRWNQTGYSFLRMQNPEAPARWQLVMSGGIFAKGQAKPGV